MYCQRDNPLKILEGNDMRIEDLKIGEFYKFFDVKVELLSRRGEYVICYDNERHTAHAVKPYSLAPWKEKVVIDRWLNIYPHGTGIHSHDTAKSAMGMAKNSDEFIETLHVRYDSSKPPKERLVVVCDE